MPVRRQILMLGSQATIYHLANFDKIRVTFSSYLRAYPLALKTFSAVSCNSVKVGEMAISLPLNC